MKLLSTTLLACLSFATLLSHAADNHGHDSHAQHNSNKHMTNDNAHGHMAMDQQAMYLVEKEVDGYKVSFHVMEATAAMHHGGSHNLMIKIEKGGEVIKDAKINSKVVHPNAHKETKTLMKMGDWYMNGYDLSHSGQHQLMILFKTADGKKHQAGVHYPE